MGVIKQVKPSKPSQSNLLRESLQKNNIETIKEENTDLEKI